MVDYRTAPSAVFFSLERIFITCLLEKQTSLLEQAVSLHPTYHVIYHDPYLITNPCLANKYGAHFKIFIGRQQIKPFPLHIPKYSVFYDEFFLSACNFRCFITNLLSVLLKIFIIIISIANIKS
jgi:hypothetical protein